MNIPFKAWLPEDAIQGGTVDRTLHDIASRWSQKWFARKTVGLVDSYGTRQPGGLPNADRMAWRGHASGLLLGVSDTGRQGIASLMLDISPHEAELTSSDRWLLDGLATSCIEDLCSELASALREPPEPWTLADEPPQPDTETAVFDLGLFAGRPLVHLRVDRAAAASLIRAQANAQHMTPLQPLSAALAQQAVRVSACLGSCSISLADLAELGPGDVVVLDRLLTAPLEVAVDSCITSGRCAAEVRASRLHLKILKSFSG